MSGLWKWDSELYVKFLAERTRPSYDLAMRIENITPSSCIDIGCGPGNSTAVLAERFPDAHMTGADYSAEMIEKAKKEHPAFDFIRFDASSDFDKITQRFDVVFSNACIQWIPDHPTLLKNMMGLLNDGGILAVQTPMNYNEPIHVIISELVKSAKWRDKLSQARIFHNLTQEEYFDVLSGISSDFNLWETVYMHRMPSHESIMEWYKGTGLRPYLSALSDNDASEFEDEVFSEVKKAYPVQANGEIIFRFPRFFFTAVK